MQSAVSKIVQPYCVIIELWHWNTIEHLIKPFTENMNTVQLSDNTKTLMQPWFDDTLA